MIDRDKLREALNRNEPPKIIDCQQTSDAKLFYDAASAYLEQADAVPEPVTPLPLHEGYTAWLIEFPNISPSFWKAGAEFDTTAKADEAVHFCRESDATEFAGSMGWNDFKVCEHLWSMGKPREKPVIDKLRFPTMLRKMWSGTEVQEWLDRQPVYAAPPVMKGKME